MVVTLGHPGMFDGTQGSTSFSADPGSLTRMGSHSADTVRHVPAEANPPTQNAPSPGLARGRSPRLISSHYRIDIATATASFLVLYIEMMQLDREVQNHVPNAPLWV